MTILGKSEVMAEVAEAFDLQQAAVADFGADLAALQHPGVAVRDEDGMQTGLERGIDVGLRAVADHPGEVGRQGVFLDETAVGVSMLFGDDVDGGEMLLQSGALELACLLGDVALGYQKKMVALSEVGQCLGNFGQDFHGMPGDGVGEAANGFVQSGVRGSTDSCSKHATRARAKLSMP